MMKTKTEREIEGLIKNSLYYEKRRSIEYNGNEKTIKYFKREDQRLSFIAERLERLVR